MKLLLWFLVVLLLAALWWWRQIPRPQPKETPPPGTWTVQDRLDQFGPDARKRWMRDFEAAGLSYPPSEVALLGFKDERQLEVQARSADGGFRFVRRIPVLGASGGPGPKLREGDKQVPEGLYRIESLNPNSRFHVSLRVNYPSPFDWEMAATEGRTEPGSDIMIHGGSASIGCLAIGDQAAEDVFTLAADTGLERIRVLLAPVDLRSRPRPSIPPEFPSWVPALYDRIGSALQVYPPRE